MNLEERLEKADEKMCMIKLCYLDAKANSGNCLDGYEGCGCDKCEGYDEECHSYIPKKEVGDMKGWEEKENKK